MSGSRPLSHSFTLLFVLQLLLYKLFLLNFNGACPSLSGNPQLCHSILQTRITMEVMQHSIKRMPSFCLVGVNVSPDDNNSISFDVDKEKLVQLIKTKSQDILDELGGIEGITSVLKSNASFGIRGDVEDLCQRRNVFGSNAFHKYRASEYIYSILRRLNDFSLLIMRDFSVLMRDFSVFMRGFSVLIRLACGVCLIRARILSHWGRNEWVEGACCVILFAAVVMLSLMVEIAIGTYFRKAKKSGLFAVVLRNGLKQHIPFSEVLVGDIVSLKRGDKVPAGGLLVSCDQSLKLDQSHLTGTTEIVEVDQVSNPYLIAGAELIEGQAKMVVTCVGKNTVCYEKEGSVYDKTVTELQAHVGILARYLEMAGLIIAASYLFISLARYFSGNSKNGDGNSEYNQGTSTASEVSYVIIDIIVAFLIIFAAMDTTNFSWAVMLGLAHAIDKMAAQNVVVRRLSAWVKLGLSVTKINVVDGNNTSIQNQVEASKFLFVPELVGSKEASFMISPNVLELVQQGISLNSTAIAYRALRTHKIEFSGSPSERAILSRELDVDWERWNENCTILKVEALEMEGRGVLAMKDDNYHLHVRGPPDMILNVSSSFYDASGSLSFLNENMRSLLKEKLRSMNAGGTIQVIAFAHKQISEEKLKNDQEYLIGKECCYSLLGFLALKEIHQGQILEEVLEECINARVGFNLIISKNHDNEAAELGEPDESNQGLKGETIVEGTTTEVDDRSASVGSGCEETTESVLVSMCIEGDETAMRSDIVILDGNYSSLILILGWASCVLRNTQSFLQFQLTTNFTSVLNTYLSTVTLPEIQGVDTRLVYLSVQLVWVNLAMGLIAAVTFGRQQPQPSQKRPDEGRKWQLITGFMWRNIMAQVVYQVLVISILQFHGPAIFGIGDEAKETVTFVMPMFLQVFNIINARKIEEKNIFAGIQPWFVLLVGILMVMPLVLVEVLVHSARFVRLDWKQWTICIGIAMVSWPVGFAVKFLPVHFLVSPLMAVKTKM